MTPILSQNIVGIFGTVIENSLSKLRTHVSSARDFATDLYFSSVDDRATTCCFFMMNSQECAQCKEYSRMWILYHSGLPPNQHQRTQEDSSLSYKEYEDLKLPWL